MSATESSNLEGKQALLNQRLEGFSALAVAFSGGADSTLLLRVARDRLGADRVLAVTAVSPFFTRAEDRHCRELAALLGVRQERIEIDLLGFAKIVANDSRRCYHCKKVILGQLQKRAADRGYVLLAEGSNRDDLDDYRPGRQAVAELAVISPLLEAGLTKSEIRRFSHQLGLPTADRPASACLATRLPYGVALTREALAAVEACEGFLQRHGFENCRVRHHGTTARIELAAADPSTLFRDPLRRDLVAHCRQAGFLHVALDLEGLRSGSLNEELP